MAEEVHSQGFAVKMVFVGNPKDIGGIDVPFEVIQTYNAYDKGTLEYLKSN